MKPPISYYGGKQRMANKIIPLIPKHTVYAEPYAGGAAIMFMKPWPDVKNKDHYREAINDIDGNLVNFYRQLRENGPELVEKIQLTLYSEEEYRISKDLDCADNIERARRYYVNITQSFGDKLNGGWRRNKSGRNSAATWANKISELPKYIARMQSVYVSNTKALDFIRQFDSPHTFFYVDPPYPGADQGHYDGFTEDDFYDLCELLDEIEGSFILSNYDSDIPPYYWERFDFSAHSSVALNANKKSGKRTEVCWRKISNVPARKEIQKLYDSGKYDCFEGGMF
jgi:DNA adenine methylase